MKDRKHKLSLFAAATEDELCVSQYLLDLGNLISISEAHRLRFTWGGKRKRSSLDESPSCSRAPQQPEAKVTASPTTPLSLSPSTESDDADADDETKHSSNKNPIKKSKEQIVEIVSQLTERRDCLRGEVENVKKYFTQLKARNSELKSVKEKVLKSWKREENTQMKTTNEGMNKLTHNYGVSILRHPQPFIHDRISQYPPCGPIRAQLYKSGLGAVINAGPVELIPDLNLEAVEEVFSYVDPSQQPLEVDVDTAARRAMCAKARRYRRDRIKVKSRNASGTQLRKSS